MLLMSTSSLKWYGIHKIFTLVKKMKFDGIDLVIEEKNYDTIDENYLKGLSDAFEIPILSITAPERGITKAKIEKLVKMAKALKVQVITFSPSHMNDKNGDWFYKHLSKVKKDLRISIAIQNVEQKFYIFIIPEYKNNNMLDLKKITWDTALNIANIEKTSGMDLMKLYAIMGNSITNVFLSDRAWAKDGLIPWNAGGGVSHLPIESFLMKLKSNGYEGFITLKVRPQEMWVGDDEKVLYNAEQFKAYFNKHYTNYQVT